MASGTSPRARDPFRTLAIVSIILGMVIVVAAVAIYYLTSPHVASPLIFGSGLTLAIGGGLPNMLSRVTAPIPDYQPPPVANQPVEPPAEAPL